VIANGRGQGSWEQTGTVVGKCSWQRSLVAQAVCAERRQSAPALPSAVDPCCAARSLSPTTSSSPVVALSTRLTRLCLSCCSPCGLHSGACSCMPNSTTRFVPRACERQPLRPGIRNAAATSAGPQARHAGGLRTSLGREEGRGSLTVQNS
jgi:hypothetical protein